MTATHATSRAHDATSAVVARRRARPLVCRITATNAGTTEHEFEVYQGDKTIDEVEGLVPGLTKQLTVTLAPGTYTIELRQAGIEARERIVVASGAHPRYARNTDEAIKPALVALCARYLSTIRDGRAIDPVANFHLTNGASLERVNWLANPEPYGIAESFGVMVNYRYDRSKMAGNAGAYLGRGEVRTSNQVKSLVRTAKS